MFGDKSVFLTTISTRRDIWLGYGGLSKGYLKMVPSQGGSGKHKERILRVILREMLKRNGIV
jgi:hypothetical protein